MYDRISGSAPLRPFYHAPVIDRVRAARDAIVYPDETYLLRAAERFLDVQESFGKVLSAVSVRDRSAVPLLAADAVTQALITLSFLNRRPLTTLATFVPEGRAFADKPPSLDALLDVLDQGRFDDLGGLQELMSRVFAEFEEMFEALAIGSSSPHPKELVPLGIVLGRLCFVVVSAASA